MITIHEIISSLGGNAVVADAIGVVPSGVSEMKRRQNIPVKYWPKMIAFAAERKVDLSTDDLVNAHTQPQARAS